MQKHFNTAGRHIAAVHDRIVAVSRFDLAHSQDLIDARVALRA
jgi:hypothetical protein